MVSTYLLVATVALTKDSTTNSSLVRSDSTLVAEVAVTPKATITKAQFQAALKKSSQKLSPEEDAVWSAKAKAGRKSGMQSVDETAKKVRQRKSANTKGI